jgi:hypothetical protein
MRVTVQPVVWPRPKAPRVQRWVVKAAVTLPLQAVDRPFVMANDAHVCETPARVTEIRLARHRPVASLVLCSRESVIVPLRTWR